MCVSSILVVGKDCNLDHEGTDWLICSLKRQQMGEKNIFLKNVASRILDMFVPSIFVLSI